MQDQNKIDIELMKKDIGSISKICEKMDGTIEKMQQVAVDISRVVSLQEQKYTMQDKIIDNIEKIVDENSDNAKKDINDVHSKIDNMGKTLSEKIDQVASERKKGYISLTDKIENSESKILKEIETLKENVHKKIYEIDLWRYGIMGAIVLGSFLITKFIDIAKILR